MEGVPLIQVPFSDREACECYNYYRGTYSNPRKGILQNFQDASIWVAGRIGRIRRIGIIIAIIGAGQAAEKSKIKSY